MAIKSNYLPSHKTRHETSTDNPRDRGGLYLYGYSCIPAICSLRALSIFSLDNSHVKDCTVSGPDTKMEFIWQSAKKFSHGVLAPHSGSTLGEVYRRSKTL
jgi:hypothetical protein